MIPQVIQIDLTEYPVSIRNTALNEILHQILAGKGKPPFAKNYDHIPLLERGAPIRVVRVDPQNYELHYFVSARGR